MSKKILSSIIIKDQQSHLSDFDLLFSCTAFSLNATSCTLYFVRPSHVEPLANDTIVDDNHTFYAQIDLQNLGIFGI